jgi:hypothetical protein
LIDNNWLFVKLKVKSYTSYLLILDFYITD